ncbi:MAG: hypothetical protein ACTSVI_06825 [Promethearchaeota archaeon]
MIDQISIIITSIFANTIVIGVMISYILLLVSTLLFAVNIDMAKKFFVNGILLLVIVIFFSASQIGIVPTSFNSLRELHLWTIPDVVIIKIWDAISNSLLVMISWISSLMVLLGFLLLLIRVDWGPKMIIIGVIMNALTILIGGGGLIAIILHQFGFDGCILA